ncbi:MAG: hypothetical protein R2815_00975 [Flavobacteriales bacterium]
MLAQAPAPDTDGDSITDPIDPCDNSTGTTCDDGDPCTSTCDTDCACAGTPLRHHGDSIDPIDATTSMTAPAMMAMIVDDVIALCLRRHACSGHRWRQHLRPRPVDNSNDGTTCDDGDPCTINDVITDCACAGTPAPDTDGDSICDPIDPCDNSNDGTTCDDGDPCTINDVITDCACAGTRSDTDGDSIATPSTRATTPTTASPAMMR